MVGGSEAPSTTDTSGILFRATTPGQTTLQVTVDSGRNLGGTISFPANGNNWGLYQFNTDGGDLPMVLSAGANVDVSGIRSKVTFALPVQLMGDVTLSTQRNRFNLADIYGSAGPGVTNTIQAVGSVEFGPISDGTGGGKLAVSMNVAASGLLDFYFDEPNTHSGDTTIGSGAILFAYHHDALSPNSALIMQDASTLFLGGNQTVPSLVLTGNTSIELNNYTLSVNTVSGTGGLSLSGDFSPAGANTFTGDVAMSFGKLSVDLLAGSDTPQPLGQGANPVQLGASGILEYTGPAATWSCGVTVTGGTATVVNNGTGTLTLGGTLAKDGTKLRLTGSQPINVAGTIVGPSPNSDLIGDGAPVTLSNANSYSGPTFVRNGGTLTPAVAGALPANTAVTLDDTGTGSSKLILGADQSIASLSLPAKSTLLTEEYHLTLASGLTVTGTDVNPVILGFDLSDAFDGEVLVTGGDFNGSPIENSVALLLDAPAFTTGSHTLIDWNGATPSDVDITDFFIDPASNLPLDLSAYTLAINGSELTIEAAPVPEPGTTLFGLALVTFSAGLRRRSRRPTSGRGSATAPGMCATQAPLR